MVTNGSDIDANCKSQYWSTAGSLSRVGSVPAVLHTLLTSFFICIYFTSFSNSCEFRQLKSTYFWGGEKTTDNFNPSAAN